MRDRWMSEAREDAALAAEALGGGGADLSGAQELDRNQALEAAVAAARPPHAPQPPFADERVERVRAQRLPQPRHRVGDGKALFEEPAFAEEPVLVEQAAQLRGKSGIV